MKEEMLRGWDRWVADPVNGWWRKLRGRQPRWQGEQQRRLGAALRERLAAAPRAVDRRKILMYSMIPWAQGGVEHLLATALRLRGHDTVTSICGGGLPDCELHYFDFQRPPCHRCVKNALRLTDAFQISPCRSTELLDQDDHAYAEQATAGMGAAELEKLDEAGIPVGKIARFQLNVFYQTFLLELNETQVEQLRKFAAAAILMARHAGRLLDRERPDIAMVSNGKAFTYRPLFLAARQRGIPVVTWEEHAFDDTLKFVFNHNCYAGEIHLDAVWPQEQQRALSPAEEAQLDEYFHKWRHGQNTPFAYHRDVCRQREHLHAQLGTRPGDSIVSCFPNMVRDTAAFDRDVAFDSLIQWILETVQFARSRPDQHFVIRAHPAEQCLPEKYGKYNQFFVCGEVRRNFPELPGNVHLLEGDTQVDTYTLVDESDVVMVYTSTVGLECALNGRLACVLGDTHYRNKGFTLDIQQRQQLWDFLAAGPPYPREISDHQVQLARRYAYLWRFRHPVVLPFFDTQRLAFDIPSVDVLQPGGHPLVDQLCEHVLSGTPFIDLTPIRPAPHQQAAA